MRRTTLLPILATLAVVASVPATASAQRGRRAPAAPEQATFSKNTLPTVKVVKERANVAAMLVDRAKKLGLDAATTDSLKRISAAIDARNAAKLEEYEDLRVKVRAAEDSGANETLEGRARVAMAGPAIQDPGKLRAADADLALAATPADKQEAARKLIADQDEDFAKLAGGRRGGRRP